MTRNVVTWLLARAYTRQHGYLPGKRSIEEMVLVVVYVLHGAPCWSAYVIVWCWRSDYHGLQTQIDLFRTSGVHRRSSVQDLLYMHDHIFIINKQQKHQMAYSFIFDVNRFSFFYISFAIVSVIFWYYLFLIFGFFLLPAARTHACHVVRLFILRTACASLRR